VACFSSPKNDRQLTSFYQQSTTNSPAKNHVLHPLLPKPPAKTPVIQPRKKLLQKRSPSDFPFDLPLPGKHLIERLWASVKGAAGSDFVFIVFIEGPTAI